MKPAQTLQVIELLDKRSLEYAAITAWKNNLVEYLGEPLDPITAELVEEATRLKVYLDRADRRALAARKPDTPTPRADQRPGLRRQLSGILKTLRIDRSGLGRTPSHKTPLPSLEDLRRRSTRSRRKRGRT